MIGTYVRLLKWSYFCTVAVVTSIYSCGPMLSSVQDRTPTSVTFVVNILLVLVTLKHIKWHTQEKTHTSVRYITVVNILLSMVALDSMNWNILLWQPLQTTWGQIQERNLTNVKNVNQVVVGLTALDNIWWYIRGEKSHTCVVSGICFTQMWQP